ncbi:MAG: glucosamine--fructose-6-phosphate aminotransferase [Sulfuricurvum sp. PC08-66]|nr:MAG: glucosamine--fructose-6-phosphate aminotransferase [Sulfuricurvum sp. PC08-66]
MCGIVGYIGQNPSKKILLDGLKELEYRGYDSAGIAVLEGDDFSIYKALGKLHNLEEKAHDFETHDFAIGIGHTRWATHGKPTELNAHPHLGQFSYVVHNGIIENYQELKSMLQSKGVTFLSQTDTEVIVHLFEHMLLTHKEPSEAFARTIEQLHGAYATLLITKQSPDTIYFAKHGSPMILAKNATHGEYFFGSSDAALIGKATQAYYLEDGDYGYVSPQGIVLKHANRTIENPAFTTLPSDRLSAQKEGFRYFMEKEIYEQSTVLADTLMGRLRDDSVYFEELAGLDTRRFSQIKLVACGTSYHSALTASYLFERLAKIHTTVEVASELRYREPLLDKNALFIVISQSGETADTLETLKMAKAAGLTTLVVCNVDNSSMVRLADYAILTRAGIEKGVASTKAFATQVTVLWMLSLFLSALPKERMQAEIATLRQLPETTKVSDTLHEKLKRLSKRYLYGHGFFFIGRDLFYPLALEGALKLKEISYLHAEGYPAGEMKHGPIALADPELITIALMPQTLLYEKTKSNVEELSARDATICAISPLEFDKSDDFIRTHAHAHPMLEFFEMMVILQLLAMEISIRLGNDVDMPRNLAKSVTVE